MSIATGLPSVTAPVPRAGVSGAELIAADLALERHADQWRRLAEERSNAFATPEWFECWQRHYGATSNTRVATVQSTSGELVGLMPLAAETGRGLHLTRLAGANMADLLHPVCAEEDEVAVAGAVAGALGSGRGAVGAIVLDNVDGAATWWHEMGAAAGLRVSERGRSVGPYATLTGLDFDEYLRSRSSNFRQRIRRIDRRITREESIELRQVGPDEVEDGMSTLLDLHDRRWADRGGSSLSSPRARAFHRDFARAASDRGWLRLFLCEDAGKPIGAFYGWSLGGRFTYYQSGLDPEYSRLSIGLFLHAKMIERAIDEGAREYDMLLGAERYKARFTDAARDLRTVVLTRRLSREGVAIGAEIGVRRALRSLPPSLRSGARRRLARINALTPTGRRR